MVLSKRRKLIAFGLVILLVTSMVIGYFVFRQQPVIADQNDQEQTKALTVTDPGPIKGLFTYGPPQGYEPLTVKFYGNPDNNSNIVSYNWEFGPEKAPILSESTYTAILHKPIIRALEVVLGISILVFFGSGLNARLAIGAWTTTLVSGLLTAFTLDSQIIKNRQYTSTDRAPNMIFLDYGSYSAKLTVTYKNNTTASQTAWITVFQYIPPDTDHNDSMTVRDTLLNRYISRRTWTQMGR